MRTREIIRWSLVVIITMLIAVAAAIWSASQREPSYTTTTRLLVVPLAQWDETFIGTSLVRDSGDASRTASTMAHLLESRSASATAAKYLGSGWTPASVDAAVTVSAAEDTNVIEVEARSTDPDRAVRAVDGFVRAVLADRWRTISAELKARIDAMSENTSDKPNAGEASLRLRMLRVVLNEGADPTLRVDSTSPVTRDKQLPVATVAGLAGGGGLFLGVLAAFGLAHGQRRMHPSGGQSTSNEPDQDRADTPPETDPVGLVDRWS